MLTPNFFKLSAENRGLKHLDYVLDIFLDMLLKAQAMKEK